MIHEAYTDVVFDENNSFSSGTEIGNIMLSDIKSPNNWYTSKELVADFEGIIRLDIPPEAKKKNNGGLFINFHKDDISETSFYFVMTKNVYSKANLLFPYSITLPVNKLVFDSASKISGRIFSYDIQAPTVIDFNKDHNLSQKANYLLIQNVISEKNTSNHCSFHTNKPIYTVGESINVSFANIPTHYDTNRASIEVLIYKPGDIPGLTRSYDWSSVKFLDKDLGPTNTLRFPVDGERNVDKFKEGDYIVRLMYNYNDLCEPVKIKVVNEKQSPSLLLNPPPKGKFYIYKLPADIRGVNLKDAQCSDYIALSFSSQSPFVDLVCETLFSLHFDIGITNSMKSCIVNTNMENTCLHNVCLLFSYLNSMLFSALSVTSCNLVNTLQKLPSSSESTDIIKEIKNYIMHRIFDPLTIEIIANQFFYSKSHISHAFKESTGLSIARYISSARMLKAKELLADESNKSITEIAHLLQFSDIHAFSHRFKRFFGVSPTKFRTEHAKVYNPTKNKD